MPIAELKDPEMRAFHQGLIKVWVYTNCDEVELFLDGKSLGTQKIERYGHGEWDVPSVEHVGLQDQDH